MIQKRLPDWPCWVLAYGAWRRARVVRMLRKNVEVRFRIPSRKGLHRSRVDADGPAIQPADFDPYDYDARARMQLPPWADRVTAPGDFPPLLSEPLEPGWTEDR